MLHKMELQITGTFNYRRPTSAMSICRMADWTVERNTRELQERHLSSNYSNNLPAINVTEVASVSSKTPLMRSTNMLQKLMEAHHNRCEMRNKGTPRF